jgi:hypothetical protein
MESAKLKDREWNGRKVLKLILQEQYTRKGLSRKVIVISAELKQRITRRSPGTLAVPHSASLVTKPKPKLNMPQTGGIFENAGRLKSFSVVLDGTKAARYQILYFGSSGLLIQNTNKTFFFNFKICKSVYHY